VDSLAGDVQIAEVGQQATNETYKVEILTCNMERPKDFSSPSPISPFGDGTQYSMVIDDDNDEVALPALPSGRREGDRGRNDDEDEESSWHYFSGQQQQMSSSARLRISDNDDDALRRPLLIQLEQHPQEPARLNWLNYLNFVTYLANLFVAYGIGVWGLGGLVPTRFAITLENKTLITPAEWSYYLWVPILLSEAVFTVFQLFPHYRARPIIQDGTGFFFFYTCVIQTAWTLFFSFRLFILSFVAVVAALMCMASLLASQHYSQTHGRRSRVEYWLFKFPFYLHCGWLILCSVVQFSLLFKHYTSNVGVQLAADIVALGFMLPAATFFLTGQPSGPDFVIPLVIIWSYVSFSFSLPSSCIRL
jgi:hypothetical protein